MFKKLLIFFSRVNIIWIKFFIVFSLSVLPMLFKFEQSFYSATVYNGFIFDSLLGFQILLFLLTILIVLCKENFLRYVACLYIFLGGISFYFSTIESGYSAASLFVLSLTIFGTLIFGLIIRHLSKFLAVLFTAAILTLYFSTLVHFFINSTVLNNLNKEILSISEDLDKGISENSDRKVYVDLYKKCRDIKSYEEKYSHYSQVLSKAKDISDKCLDEVFSKYDANILTKSNIYFCDNLNTKSFSLEEFNFCKKDLYLNFLNSKLRTVESGVYFSDNDLHQLPNQEDINRFVNFCLTFDKNQDDFYNPISCMDYVLSRQSRSLSMQKYICSNDSYAKSEVDKKYCTQKVADPLKALDSLKGTCYEEIFTEVYKAKENYNDEEKVLSFLKFYKAFDNCILTDIYPLKYSDYNYSDPVRLDIQGMLKENQENSDFYDSVVGSYLNTLISGEQGNFDCNLFSKYFTDKTIVSECLNYNKLLKNI